MANEATIVAGISASKNGAVLAPGTSTTQYSMTGDIMASGVVGTSTSPALLDLGPLTGTSIGGIWFKNLDATDTITISGEVGMTAVFQLVILPGKSNVVTPLDDVFYVVSSANTPNLYWAAFEA